MHFNWGASAGIHILNSSYDKEVWLTSLVTSNRKLNWNVGMNQQ